MNVKRVKWPFGLFYRTRAEKPERVFSGPPGRFRLIIIFLIFSALVVSTALILFPVNRAIIQAMGEMRDGFITRAEEYTGYRLEYASLGPSIFSTLDLRDFAMLREDGSVFLSVSRLELSYSLFSLLQGKNAAAFRSARIDRPRLNLDMEKDAALIKMLTAGDAPPLLETLPAHFSVKLRGGEGSLFLENFDLDIRNLSLDASVRSGSVNFQGKWNAEGRIAMQGIAGNGISAAMTGRISGDYSEDRGRANITIPSLAGESFRLRPLSFSVVLENRILEVHKIYDRSPSSISLYWDMEEEGIRAYFSAENFSPRDMVALSGPLRDQNAWLGVRLSGQAAFEKFKEREPLYSLNFRGFFLDEAPLRGGRFTILANGSSEKIEFRECSFYGPYGYVSYTGGLGFSPLTPNGTLSLSEFGLGGSPSERISADLFFSATSTEINISGGALTAGALVVQGLSASVYRDGSGMNFNFSAVKQDDPQQQGEAAGLLLLDGSMDYEPRNIWASLSVNSFSVRDILELIRPFSSQALVPGPILEVLGGLSLNTEVFFSTDYDHVLYNVPRFIVQFSDTGEILATASLSGTGDHFELANCRIFLPGMKPRPASLMFDTLAQDFRLPATGKTLSLSAFVDFSNSSDITFSSMASYDDLAYYLDGSFLDRNSLIINGSYGLQAYLSTAGVSSWSGFAQADHFPLPQEDQPASLSFLISLRYDSPDFWHSAIEYFEIDGISSSVSPAVFRLEGDADQDGLEITKLAYTDAAGELAGNLRLLWDSGYQDFSLSALMENPRSGESYKLSALFEDKMFSLDFSGNKMQLDRIIAADNAVASGNISAGWTAMDNFRVEAELSSLKLIRNGRDLEIRAGAVLDPEEFMLYNMAVHYGELEATAPYFRIDRPAGLAAARAEIHGANQGREINVEMQGQAQFAVFSNWLGIRRVTESLAGTLVLDRAHYDTYEAGEPFSFAFSSQKDESGYYVNFGGGPRNMVRFLYSPAANSEGGNFYAALSNPSPIRGSFTGYIDSKTIDANTTDLYGDLESLWKVFPFLDSVALPGGVVDASLRIVGPLREPNFYGAAKVRSLKVQVPDFVAGDIRPVPLTLTLSGNEMSFGPIEASVGNGIGIVSAWFRFDGWIPNAFDMDIYVPGESPVPFVFNASGIIANGSAAGTLKLVLEDTVMSVSGDLTAQNAEIGLNFDEIAAMEENGAWPDDLENASVVDITIRTGRRVEFFWPSFDFPILQARADLGSNIRITSDTAARQFTLTGNTRLRSGEIFYLDRNFYIRDGTLFFRENELEFDPRISARAEIRDQGPEGPVTISMVIDNAPLSSFAPRFESNPPLSQFEIYSILGQNPQDDPARGMNILISSGFETLTNYAIMRRLQRGARDILGLDMFSVRTQAVQNFVFQLTGVNEFFAASSNPREQPNFNRMGTYFDKTTLFVGKYIGTEIFTQALLNFRYDEERQNLGGMYLEPEIGLEMRNPLFDIQFNMIPLNSNNWFIDGASFTLSWRRSF